MDFTKHAMILAVIDALREHGSWTGKTHVQKALSLLQDKGSVEVPFRFVLYRHGPYSFDIQDELEQMRSYSALEVEPNPQGYGVVLMSGQNAGIAEQMGELSEEESEAVSDVCRFVRDRGVQELERLATASWIRSQEKIGDTRGVAERLNELKPHIEIPAAEAADREVETWLADQ